MKKFEREGGGQFHLAYSGAPNPRAAFQSSPAIQRNALSFSEYFRDVVHTLRTRSLERHSLCSNNLLRAIAENVLSYPFSPDRLWRFDSAL